jgi:ribonuclease D
VLIDRSDRLRELCDRLRASQTPIAFDTEFVSERRYRPALALIQVGAREGEKGFIETIIDPLRLDITPFLELIADPAVTKVLHSGSQDLQILWERFDCAAHNVFDTQIAAAFLGFGYQIGYAELAKRVGGAPQLSKDLQFSDWMARPLSRAQMDYALSDIRYLPAMHEYLRDELAARRRESWAHAEFVRAENKARETTPPQEVYKKFNTARLSRRQLGNLRELAAMREEIARAEDKPPSFIMPDAGLMQIAKQPPQNSAAMRATRGVPGGALTYARDFLEALKRAAHLSDDELPEVWNGERADPQVENVAVLLGVVAGLRADENQIARTYLAPRDQLTALANWWFGEEQATLPTSPLLTDWRREIVGDELLAILRGEIEIALDPQTKSLRMLPAKIEN